MASAQQQQPFPAPPPFLTETSPDPPPPIGPGPFGPSVDDHSMHRRNSETDLNVEERPRSYRPSTGCWFVTMGHQRANRYAQPRTRRPSPLPRLERAASTNLYNSRPNTPCRCPTANHETSAGTGEAE